MATYGTKSGFEIRADLLSQAQGLLEMNAQRELDAAYFAIDQAGDEASLISLPVISLTWFTTSSTEYPFSGAKFNIRFSF